MPMYICPRCRKVSTRMESNNDVICNCNEPSNGRAVQQEDVLDIGKYTDFNGQEQLGRITNLNRGMDNVASTKTRICGGKSFTRTNRGNKKSLVRTRDNLEFIDFRSDSACGDD